MDMDNFEFRPLTNGLGFDKTIEEKKAKITEPAKPIIKPQLKPSHFFEEKKPEIPNPAPVSRSLKKIVLKLHFFQKNQRWSPLSFQKRHFQNLKRRMWQPEQTLISLWITAFIMPFQKQSLIKAFTIKQ